jgi:hypothetical protein
MKTAVISAYYFLPFYPSHMCVRLFGWLFAAADVCL